MSDFIIKQNLAYAYQIMSHLKLDDHTYTHLSARSEEEKNSYFIYPFGLRFEEVEPDVFMKISLNGPVLEGQEYQYNKTGYTIHGAVYDSRPDIYALFHVHTPAIVAVSACDKGLLPLSQWALHFYGRLSYHRYDSLELETHQSKTLQKSFGSDNFVMMMHNHGALIGGRTLQEAMFYTYHLHQACLAQCLTLPMQQTMILPSEQVCQKAVQDLTGFEKDLGQRDWQAWVRLIDSIKSGRKDKKENQES